MRCSLAPALADPALPEALSAQLRCLDPWLINQYQRHYFISADGRFRLTVDWDFRFGTALGPRTVMVRAGQGAPSVVLEVKYEVQHALDADLVTNSLPLRMTRCSKFILGVQGL